MKEHTRLLPYGRENPVIYDNDAHADVYTDELTLALCSLGEVNVRGFVTTSVENQYVNQECYLLDLNGRAAILEKARRAGFRNIPPHAAGPNKPLVAPASGRLEDTMPIDTPGSRLIVSEANKASADKPLVLVMGGPLTAAADAWLLDPTISDRVIVAWIGGTVSGMNDYNGWSDAWASLIVACKLRLVQFPVNQGEASVPKSRLSLLPDNEFTRWMVDKKLPHASLPRERDADSQPVISLLRPDYTMETRRFSFNHMVPSWHGEQVPAYREDVDGNVLIATRTDAGVATREWWRVMESPGLWAGAARVAAKAHRSFYAAPFPIGKIARFEAEDF